LARGVGVLSQLWFTFLKRGNTVKLAALMQKTYHILRTSLRRMGQMIVAMTGSFDAHPRLLERSSGWLHHCHPHYDVLP
jgi:hypothetical protein